MDEKLILNNGQEITGHLIETNDRLFLYMFGISMSEVFSALSDPDNVKSIAWERSGEGGTVKGYKHLYSVTEESNTLVSAALRK